mgnify:CR=1 FL=1
MKKLKLVTILQSVMITGLILVIAGLLLLRKEHKEQTVPVSLSSGSAEYETEILESEIIYETTGQKIFLRDSEFGEIWIPVSDGLQKGHENYEPVRKNPERTVSPKPYEEMTIEELQAEILAKMAANGPVTDRMRQDVLENIYPNSLLNWVRSFH